MFENIYFKYLLLHQYSSIPVPHCYVISGSDEYWNDPTKLGNVPEVTELPSSCFLVQFGLWGNSNKDDTAAMGVSMWKQMHQ